MKADKVFKALGVILFILCACVILGVSMKLVFEMILRTM